MPSSGNDHHMIITNKRAGFKIELRVSLDEGVASMVEGDVLMLKCMYDEDDGYRVKKELEAVVAKHTAEGKDMEVNFRLELYDELYALRVYYRVNIPFSDDKSDF